MHSSHVKVRRHAQARVERTSEKGIGQCRVETGPKSRPCVGQCSHQRAFDEDGARIESTMIERVFADGWQLAFPSEQYAFYIHM